MYDIKAMLPLIQKAKLENAKHELEGCGYGGPAMERAYGTLKTHADRYLERHVIKNDTPVVSMNVPGVAENSEVSFGSEHNFLLHIQGREELRKSISLFVQAIVMQVLLNAEQGWVELCLLDGKNAGSSLGTLNKVAAGNDRLYGGKVFSRENDMVNALDQLQKSIEENITLFSGAGSETAYAYNRDSGKHVPVMVAVLYDYDSFSQYARQRAEKIEQNARQAGISIIKVCFDENTPVQPGYFALAMTEPAKAEICYGTMKSSVSLNYIPIMEEMTDKVLEKRKIDSLASNNLDLNRIEYKEHPYKKLHIPLGVDEDGEIVEMDLAENISAHCLISGGTGSGKSTTLHAIISGLIMNYHPDDLRIWAIDYKAVEFAVYAGHRTPHFSVIGQDNSHEFSYSLLDLVQAEYERRKKLFMRNGNIENYEEFRKKGFSLPRIVIIIDEFQRMTQAARENPKYQTMLENQLSEIRAMGMTYVLCSQSVANGLQGLTAKAKNQIMVRICMKQTSSEEIREAIPEMGPDSQMHIRNVLDFGIGQMLYRKPEKSGGYTYHYLKGLFFPDESRRALIHSINAYVGENYDHTIPTVIQRNSDRYAITEKTRHVLNQFVNGGEMPESEEGILFCPGAPCNLDDDLVIDLACSSGSNLIMAIADRNMRESVLLFTVMSLLSNSSIRVNITMPEENGSLAKGLLQLLQRLKTNRLGIYQGPEEVLSHLSSMEKLKNLYGQRQVEIIVGIHRLRPVLEAYLEESEDQGGKEEKTAKSSFQPIETKNRSEDDILDDLTRMLAELEGDLVESKPEKKVENADQKILSMEEIDKLLTNLYKKGPERGYFTMQVISGAKQLKQGGISRLDDFEYRIGGTMTSGDAYTLFESEHFLERANEQTLMYYPGSKNDGKAIRPYLIPDDEYIEKWNRRVKDE